MDGPGMSSRNSRMRAVVTFPIFATEPLESLASVLVGVIAAARMLQPDRGIASGGLAWGQLRDRGWFAPISALIGVLTTFRFSLFWIHVVSMLVT